eukprot:SM000007S20897  [mRNA]  locus=s7:884989:886751:+ [translate_table: standard]
MPRAVVVEAAADGGGGGDPMDRVVLRDKAKPTPAPGEILVRITIRPVNPSDVATIQRQGLAGQLPLVPGEEGAGVVEEVGPGVSKFKRGQRVVALVFFRRAARWEGTWQEYLLVKAVDAVPIPDTISDEAAAQFVINPWTVYGMLNDAAVPEGEYLLQTAAASVIGRQMIQLAKHRGIRTINLVRREEQKEQLHSIGANAVINFETEDVVARVKEITQGHLAYTAVDAVGGELTKRVAASVRKEGTVFIYGDLAGPSFCVDVADVLQRGVRILGWNLDTRVTREEDKRKIAREMFQLLEERVVVPFAGEKFDLADFRTAIRKSQETGRSGKVFLVG